MAQEEGEGLLNLAVMELEPSRRWVTAAQHGMVAEGIHGALAAQA